uniref:G-protein coupled receptors family 1 profile domain-containing protein n=1 Tax=Mesocestoides corti TaxID=53468 RepID=A0A5K3FU52_MESCO
MKTSCSKRLLKILIYVNGLIVIIIGFICNCIVVHLLLSPHETNAITPIGCVILIIVAGELCTVGVVGIIGAWKEGTCMLYSFAIRATILSLFELAVAIFIFIGQGPFVSVFGAAIEKRIKKSQSEGAHMAVPSID